MMASPAELKYFLEVAVSLNLSRASERLGISQPSLSSAIKRLENNIGTDILIRHKKGVTLTQAGKQLLAHTKQLMQFWDDLKSQALASHNEAQGNFTLGCHPSIGLYYSPKFLGRILENNPKLEINFVHDISRRITERVINLSVDIAIVANPIKHPDLVIKKIRNDEVTLWTSGEKKSILNINSGEAVIICDPDLAQTQNLLKRCKKQGILYSRIVKTDNLELVAELTASGCGIGIMPSSIAQTYHSKKIKRVEKAPVYQDEICLIFRHENRHVRALQIIAQGIKDC